MSVTAGEKLGSFEGTGQDPSGPAPRALCRDHVRRTQHHPELARGAARRLAIIRHTQEVTGNVSMTCRYFGITRQAFYKWLRRYEGQGLGELRDSSRRPTHTRSPDGSSLASSTRENHDLSS